ncbi:response regulator [Prevotella copri]|jgi:putative two-component system sensor histidine kinase/response regulator, hybrid (one-component system)|uniref:hybrid sensor histidine kinase/response regulator transcription factor n=1 Tax=Segatella copri TaxID=165179 RepID=UPI001C38704F|nr:ATP-binding protein [Segatella copri]MBV3401912.1 response regulator [Segatella copri]
MKALRLYLIFIVFFVSHLLASAQSSFRLINTSAGLPDDEVKALFWTSDGRLGVRTSSSLSFFDGCTFHSVPPMGDEAYAADYVSALSTAYVDARQRVWIKELGKLLVFDLTKDAYVRDVKGLLASMGIKEKVRDMFIDSGKDLWFVTASGKMLMVKASKIGEQENPCRQMKIRTKGLRDVCNFNGNHWFLYADGWVKGMNAAMTKTISVERVWQGEVPARDFMQFAQNKHQLWLMWNRGVASYQPSSTATHHWQHRYENEAAALVVLSIAEDGTAYASIRQAGLLTIAPNGKTSLLTEIHTLDGETLIDDIQGIACSRGNLLLGLWSKGLCLYHPNMQQFAYFPFVAMGLKMNGYRINDLPNGLPLLSSDKGLFALNALSHHASPISLGGSDYIWSMMDSKGRLWAGTFRQGLFLREKGIVHHIMQGGIPAKDINYDIVRGFLEDHAHRIWVNYHGGIGCFDEQRRRIVPLGNKALEKYKVVNDFKEDRLHRIWVAATQGLFVYSPASRRALFPKDLVKDEATQVKLNGPCKVLLIDHQGWVWVGTLNGLFVINPKDKSSRFFGRAEGMPNEMINGLIEDRYGNVWVSTPSGLCRFQRLQDGEMKLMVFDSQNKLGKSNFGCMTVGHLAGGNLFFGTQDGYYIVNPADVKEMKYTGHPIFTSLRVNNQELVPGKEVDGRTILTSALSATEKLVLKHHENFITILFSGLNFDMPSHTYYKYRLKGMSDRWIEMNPQDGVGRANFTDLAPGSYVLEVYSAGFDKVWSEQPATLLIEVQPPLWATWWAKLIYLLFFIAILTWGYRWKMEQNRKRMEDEKYKELEEMKYRFFTNISHEFRTLLTLIITPIGSILKRTTDSETRHQLNDVSRNAGDLLQLVNQLLDFRKMEMNGERLNLQSGNLNEFIQYTTMKFMPLAEQKNIRLTFEDKTEGLFMYFDKDKVGKVLTNLLSNAFKFTKAGGKVNVCLEKCILDSRRCAHIVVEDTGCGIPKEEQGHVFERFYRTEQDSSSQQIGSGIGLNMVYEYIQLHEGKVSLESEEGKGSRFIVDIPTDLKREVQQEASEENCIASPVMDDVVDGAVGVQTSRKIEKTVLVVEDNEDFSHFLSQELGRIYNKVLMAKDGIEGAMKAEAENPDIIVSDVMMPRMNGTDMCRRIKENIETSHIPIILLTAWSTDEGRATGYKAGADAYIAKPFDMEVLLARISNLLEKQEKRQRDFSHSISLDPKTVTDSSPDEDFLKEVIACIEKNIDNSEYTIDSLSTDIVMSRMSLYRKMKSLTGQTPADFIRTVRLKTAAKLLKEEKCTVSEACYRTGFASPQNFSKHFKEMFGVLPSQYS